MKLLIDSRWKKFLSVLVLSVLAFSNLSMHWNPALEILDQRDRELAKSRGPALTSVPGEEPNWESYNDWQCFPVEVIDAQCIKYCKPEGCDPNTDYDVPSISVEYAEHLYQFDHDFENSVQCQDIIQQWKILFQDQTGVCIYAAMLPAQAVKPNDPNQSLWTLYNIKTKKGIWRRDYLPYLEEE